VLILTRKAEQGIVIDGIIRVQILAVDGDRVKIGIDAPANVGVLREELVDQVAGANREAAEGTPSGQGRQIAERLRGFDDQLLRRRAAR
jgi:carbon storage regulator